MTLSDAAWQEVRRRASFACEYCGVSEIDAGGLLTVDHYQPRSEQGADDLANLIYSCFRCNNYKHDYWPKSPSEPQLWNPRQEPAERHLILLGDGRLHSISPTGSFTLELLQLNRPPLIAHRLRKLEDLADSQRLVRLQAILAILERLRHQHRELTKEQMALLDENRRLLALLLREES